MIRYALACADGHAFESWFPSSDAYETQRKRKLVACPVCGSTKVDKQLMTPRIAASRRPAAPPPAATAGEEPAREVALMSPQEAELRRKLKELRAELVKNADYVGHGFPDEARRMHAGEIEHRSIWGEATSEEAAALVEEGVEVHPLPPALDDRN